MGIFFHIWVVRSDRSTVFIHNKAPTLPTYWKGIHRFSSALLNPAGQHGSFIYKLLLNIWLNCNLPSMTWSWSGYVDGIVGGLLVAVHPDDRFELLEADIGNTKTIIKIPGSRLGNIISRSFMWWAERCFLRAILHLKSQWPNGSHEKNGQIGCLYCVAIISSDDHVLISPAFVELIIVAEFFVPRFLWSPHVHSQHRKDDTCRFVDQRVWFTPKLLRGTPKTGANWRSSADKMSWPTSSYGLKSSGILTSNWTDDYCAFYCT